MLHSVLINPDQDLHRQLAVNLFHAWLLDCYYHDYPEHEIIELIAAINDDLPSLCLDQYLS